MDRSVDNALILTTCVVFERPGDIHPASATTVVAGLSLFQRTVFTLQRGGIGRLIVLSGDDTDQLRTHLDGDPRLHADLRWLPVNEFPPSDPRTWEVMSGMMGGPYLIVSTGAVFPASLVSRVRAVAGRGEAVVVTRGVCRVMPRPRPHATASESAGTGGVVTLETTIADSQNADLLAIPEGFTCSGWASSQDAPYPLQAALDRGVRQGQVTLMSLESDWYQDVRGGKADLPQSVEKAEWTLLNSLRGGLEGFVDRHFNRHCSKWLTLGFLQTPLTPNAVTYLATAVGLLAAFAFAQGGYVAGIIGAVLFQLSAILDCCDGEVARLKFLESSFGQRLDVALDNVVHVGLYLGMAWAAQAEWGLFAVILGGLATFGNGVAFAVVQQTLKVRDRLDPLRRRRVDEILTRIVSRDFSVLILALALVGHVEWFLLLAAVGSNIFWPLLIWQLRSPNPLR